MSCMDCNFHGPPVSDYTGPKPCSECVQADGFKKQEPPKKDRRQTDMKVETHGTLVYVDGKLVKGTAEEVNRQINIGEQPTIESGGDAMRRVASNLGFSFADTVVEPNFKTEMSLK